MDQLVKLIFVYQELVVQLGSRNFGHHFPVTSKNYDVNHSLL
jgi:hypothetical protein